MIDHVSSTSKYDMICAIIINIDWYLKRWFMPNDNKEIIWIGDPNVTRHRKHLAYGSSQSVRYLWHGWPNP